MARRRAPLTARSPAGTLEAGETPLRCGKRELVEETGHAARRWRRLGTFYTAPGFCTELMHVNEARDLRPARGELDDDEYLSVVELELRQALRLARAGRIRDAKTLGALLLAVRA